MIGSKHITVIAAVLMALALVFTVLAMSHMNQTALSRLTGTVTYSDLHAVTFTEDDYYSNYSENGIAKINLSGSIATSKSPNVTVDGSTVTILGGGTYVLSGTLNGSIIVDSGDDAEVRLVLNGVDITASDSAALYIKQSQKTVLSLVDGTENHLSDGRAYADETITAALYSKDDLTINGNGSLRVTGNCQDGIKVNDTFKMTEGSLVVTAVDDGMNINDAAAFLATTVTVTSGGDALKCENESTEWGFITLEATAFTAESEGDGMVASSAIYAKDATVRVVAGGGAGDLQIESAGFERPGRFGFDAQTTSNAVSQKAIKATSNISLTGGVFVLDSADDAIHSDGDLSVSDGDYTIATGDDALHAEMNMTLEPKTLTVTKCREGIEAAYVVINGGEIRIVSADDAINAVGENANGGFGVPMSRKTTFTADEIYLTINGGNINIETGGDGVDSNGAALVSGGRVEVYGPENSGNSSLDFEYGFVINGGTVLAAGNSGMAELPSGASLQQALVFYLDETCAAGSRIVLTDSNGNELLSGTSAKQFDWVCVSMSDITMGETYTLTINETEMNTVEATETVTSSGTRGGSWQW